MAKWETFYWGEELWEGLPLTTELRFYDRNETLVKVIASEAKNFPLIDVDFEFLRNGGCGKFWFTTSEDLNLEQGYRCDIYFYKMKWYSGRIQKAPLEGTQNIYRYEGFGYFSELDWKIISETYENVELSSIVTNILEKYYFGKSHIVE